MESQYWAAIFVPIGVLVVFFTYCGVCMARAAFRPEIRPDNFEVKIKEGLATRKKPIVALVGDSHTHCTYGYDWVTPLANKYPQFQFLNAGINGERADQILARFDPIVSCNPDLVTVIVGSNDRLSSVSRCAACAYGQCVRPRELDHFKTDMRTMLQRLLRQTHGTIAVFSIPNVEAEPNAVIHKKTRLVNEHLRNLVQEFDTPRMVYVPFAEALECYSIPESQGGAFNEKHPPSLLWTPANFIYNTMKVQFLHWVIGYSYEELSRKNGLYTTSDALHFNAHAASFLTHFVETFICNNAARLLSPEAMRMLAPASDRPVTLPELNGRTVKDRSPNLSDDTDEKTSALDSPVNPHPTSSYYQPATTTAAPQPVDDEAKSDAPEIELTNLGQSANDADASTLLTPVTLVLDSDIDQQTDAPQPVQQSE